MVPTSQLYHSPARETSFRDDTGLKPTLFLRHHGSVLIERYEYALGPASVRDSHLRPSNALQDDMDAQLAMEGTFGHDETLDNLFVAMQRNVNHQVQSCAKPGRQHP